MNAEQEIRLILGDQIVQIVTLKHQLAEAQKEIAALKAKQKEQPSEA